MTADVLEERCLAVLSMVALGELRFEKAGVLLLVLEPAARPPARRGRASA